MELEITDSDHQGTSQMTEVQHALAYHAAKQSCYSIMNPEFERHALAVEAAMAELAADQPNNRHPVTTMQA